MIIENEIISFKSFPVHFADERNGLKPNTVRLLNKHEAEEVNNKLESIKKIRIFNTANLNESFIRDISNITDVTGAAKMPLKYGWKCFVFSWVHEK